MEIKLKKDLSPQKNAEVFYRKSKNQQIEIQKLTEGIVRKEKEVSGLLANISAIESTQDVKALRAFMESSGLNQEAAKKRKTSALS
jgi:hypothetical protein